MELTEDPCVNTQKFLKKMVKNFDIISSSQIIEEDIFHVKFIYNKILNSYLEQINNGNDKYYNFISSKTKLNSSNHKDSKILLSDDDIENFFIEENVKFFKKMELSQKDNLKNFYNMILNENLKFENFDSYNHKFKKELTIFFLKKLICYVKYIYPFEENLSEKFKNQIDCLLTFLKVEKITIKTLLENITSNVTSDISNENYHDELKNILSFFLGKINLEFKIQSYNESIKNYKYYSIKPSDLSYNIFYSSKLIYFLSKIYSSDNSEKKYISNCFDKFINIVKTNVFVLKNNMIKKNNENALINNKLQWIDNIFSFENKNYKNTITNHFYKIMDYDDYENLIKSGLFLLDLESFRFGEKYDEKFYYILTFIRYYLIKKTKPSKINQNNEIIIKITDSKIFEKKLRNISFDTFINDISKENTELLEKLNKHIKCKFPNINITNYEKIKNLDFLKYDCGLLKRKNDVEKNQNIKTTNVPFKKLIKEKNKNHEILDLVFIFYYLKNEKEMYIDLYQIFYNILKFINHPKENNNLNNNSIFLKIKNLLSEILKEFKYIPEFPKEYLFFDFSDILFSEIMKFLFKTESDVFIELFSLIEKNILLFSKNAYSTGDIKNDINYLL